MDLILTILIFLSAFIASFIGIMSAGASAINVPILLMVGIPPQIALANNKVGIFSTGLGSFLNFHKHNKIVWALIPPMIGIGVVGSFIGSNILLQIPESILSKVVGVILLALIPVFWFNKKSGIVHENVSQTRKFMAHLGYFFVEVWRGFFGAGAGFFGLTVATWGYGLPFIHAKATLKIASMFATFVSIAVFYFAGLLQLYLSGTILAGMMLGSYCGSHIAIKKGDTFVKPLIIILLFISGLKLLFF